MSTAPRIGFVGAGRMAAALARGWLAAGLAAPDRLAASDPVPQAREAFARDTGVTPGVDNPPVLVASEVVVLAVKPQTMTPVLEEVRLLLEPHHLVVSIAAGI